MSQEFVKPVIEAIAGKASVNRVVARQLEKIERARRELQAAMYDLSEQRRLIVTLSQRFAPEEAPKAAAEPQLKNAEVSSVATSGLNGAPPEPGPATEAQPGLTEREKLVAREIIDKGLTE